MSVAEQIDHDTIAVTVNLATRAAQTRLEDVPEEARAVARQCLVDWFAVTLSGCREPAVAILEETAREDGGNPQATLVGLGRKASLAQAALINGTASHALDYDDVNTALSGHPTVTVAPAVLALAEWRGLSGAETLKAFIAGYEVACRAGALVAPGHYQRGFHATGTAGTFGAAAGAGVALGLDRDAIANALGIAAAQAAGLKHLFGTMCKPLHAGKAAANGLLAARLSARGFTGRGDVLEAPQGFAAAMSPDCNAEAATAETGRWHVRDTLFKYHAACYLTHASINVLQEMVRENGLAADAVEQVTLTVDPGHLKVCNIAEPDTGLEVKFSLRHTAAFALAGIDTASVDAYADTLARREDLVALRRRVRVETEAGLARESRVRVELKDGGVLEGRFDSGVPAADVATQGQRLDAKFRALAGPVLGTAAAEALLARLHDIENLADAGSLLDAAARPA